MHSPPGKIMSGHSAKFVVAASLSGLCLAVSACSGLTPSPPPVVAAPAAPEPPAPGVVGVAIGQSLSDKDKDAAIAAQQAAVSSGQRKAWKGAHGAYGFVTPEPEGASGCRGYTHRIFINGRPQEAKGEACKAGDAWRVKS
jgi:surface antigen